MAAIENSICVLIVTYGNRWQFLSQVIESVLSFKTVSSIIIVNNAAEYNLKSKTRHFNDDRLLVVDLQENSGSASGYKTALENARNTNASFYWFLDDDNLPETDTANILLKHWQLIDAADNKKALFCLRTDRLQHLRIAKGESPYRYYLVPDNFMGFHFMKIFSNQLKKLQDKKADTKPFLNRAAMPYVPYGGLFIHKNIIPDIGYPNELFYLYVDDSEFTYRITEKGGTIWLIPAAKINDIDKSQGIGYKNSLFHSPVLDLWSFRTYYHTRNRMYFYSKKTVKNKLFFKINKVLYLANLRFASIISGKQDTFKKVKQAIADGLNGVMGKANPQKF